MKRVDSPQWNRFIIVSLIPAALAFLGSQNAARADIIKVTCVGISSLSGAPVGSFLIQGFQANELVDFEMVIDSTVVDVNPSVGTGDFHDPSGSYRFVGQSSGAILHLDGGGVRFITTTSSNYTFASLAADNPWIGDPFNAWRGSNFSNLDDLPTVLAEMAGTHFEVEDVDWHIRTAGGNQHLTPAASYDVFVSNAVPEPSAFAACATVILGFMLIDVSRTRRQRRGG